MISINNAQWTILVCHQGVVFLWVVRRRRWLSFLTKIKTTWFMLIDTHLNILSALESNIKQGTSRSHLGDKCSKNTGETARKAYMDRIWYWWISRRLQSTTLLKLNSTKFVKTKYISEHLFDRIPTEFRRTLLGLIESLKSKV